MKTNYDEFTKQPVAKMAQSISDMTFMFDETRVPAKHYKALLAKPMAEMVEESIAINLLNTYFKTWQITSLIRTSPESFNGSLLMMYF